MKYSTIILIIRGWFNQKMNGIHKKLRYAEIASKPKKRGINHTCRLENYWIVWISFKYNFVDLFL